jgi:hypothetical protein
MNPVKAGLCVLPEDWRFKDPDGNIFGIHQPDPSAR